MGVGVTPFTFARANPNVRRTETTSRSSSAPPRTHERPCRPSAWSTRSPKRRLRTRSAVSPPASPLWGGDGTFEEVAELWVGGTELSRGSYYDVEDLAKIRFTCPPGGSRRVLRAQAMIRTDWPLTWTARRRRRKPPAESRPGR